MHPANQDSTNLKYSPHFKRLHYKEVETLLNLLADMEDLTPEEEAVQAKLEEIKAAMVHKRKVEDARAAEAIKDAGITPVRRRK